MRQQGATRAMLFARVALSLGIMLRPMLSLTPQDTIDVGPAERYDVTWAAREPGTWLIHCHVPHHATNNNVEEQGAGGSTMLIDVRP